MIEFLRFSKKYANGTLACDDISFTAHRGITVLLGANGSGKTTLLKAVAGEHYATSGNVFVSDENENKFDIAKTVKKTKQLVGFSNDENFFREKKIVLDFLLEKLFSFHFSTDKIAHEIAQLSKLCNIETVLQKKIFTLSKGFQKRVSLADSLAGNPENILLDEPASSLDLLQTKELYALLKKIACTKTILLSTHSMSELETLADKIIILSYGKKKFEGSVNELFASSRKKTIEESFLFFAQLEENKNEK